MSVSLKDVEHIARLARLSFAEDEKKVLLQQLNEVLAYMEQLSELDTEGVEPLSHVIQLQNVFREDLRRECLDREEVLRNAPARTEEFFKVPKVIAER